MKNLLKKMKEENGFTLVEMAIVILIIAALLLIIIPNISGVTKNVDKTTGEAIENTIETQKVLYEVEHNSKPTIDDLKEEGYITESQVTKYNDYIASKED